MTIKKYEYRDSQREFTREQYAHGVKLADIINLYYATDPAKAEAETQKAGYRQDSIGQWFYVDKDRSLSVPVPPALQTDPLSKRLAVGPQPMASGTWEMPHGTGENI